jgi:glyoxylase-like metal-dependent hydrolase (beta-lactamase superfamily II)
MEVFLANIKSFSSRHFQLEQLADGVYAAINSEEGWAICNAGIIDLGDRTLLFDAFMTPEAAGDLRNAAESLFDRPVHGVINSHYHNDHIWGNQAFYSDVEIISSTRTRELIITEGPMEVQGFRDGAQTRLEALEAQFIEARDEFTRNNLRGFIIYFQAILATLPELQIRQPNLTFTGDLIFNGPKRSAKLITFEGGHCGSDAILHLPDDGIVFMSDLLFSGGHPYLADGDPHRVKLILAQVRELQARTFVPGHGPVGQTDHLDWMDEYINSLNTLVREAIKKGATEAEIDKIVMPGKYQHLIFPSFFTANLKFLYQQQLKRRTNATNS